MKWIRAVILLAIFSQSPQLFAQPLPRIIILATGGTIAGQGAASDRAKYASGKIPVDDLVAAIPSVKNIASISGEQIASIGSYDMTVEIWLKLANRINEIFNNNEADGVVITHGTDTQEETAFFLSCTVKRGNPVVVTGSMRPATAISADGPKNLYDAILVAANPQSKNRGVLVSFNENLYDGRSIVKVNTTNVNAFAAPNSGPVGHVYDGKLDYYTTADNTTKGIFFDVSKLQQLPRVDIVYMYAGAPATLINTIVNEKAQGLIIGGVGNGNMNKAFLAAVDSAVKKGVTVVRSTRVVSGSVTLYNEIDDEKLGTLVAGELNPPKARILLMLALTKTTGRKQLQELFLQH